MSNKLINDENVKSWLDRFMAGDTTCDEEKMIYEYFHRRKLPKELELYRAMMAWYEAGMPEDMPKEMARKSRVARRLRWWHYASVAASLLVLSVLGIKFIGQSSHTQEYAIYEGSYIVRDGVKITDLDVILPELKRAEAYIESNREDVPSAQSMLAEAVLEGIDDEYSREVVKKAIFDN